MSERRSPDPSVPRPPGVKSQRTPWRRFAVVDASILLALLSFFGILKSFALNPAVGDENIWFYSARLWSDGIWPYRDFFVAHPPLHLLPGVLLLNLIGEFHLGTFKLLPAFAAAATGGCVYFIGKRAGGTVAGTVAAALFLFNYDLLRASSHWTGINWAVMWLTGGMLAALSGRGIVAGVLLGWGLDTGVYVGAGALIISALLLLVRGREGCRCAIAALVTWLIPNAVFGAVAGNAYFDQVYRYHLLKPPGIRSGLTDVLPASLFHDFFLITGPIFLAPLLIIWAAARLQKSKRRDSWRILLDPTRHPALATGVWSGALWIATIFFLAFLSRVFPYYLLLCFPAAAVCGGIYVAKLFAYASAARRNPALAFAAGTMAALLLFGFVQVPRLEQRLPYFRAAEGKTRRYTLPHSPLPAAFQAPVTALFWHEDRVYGERYTGIQFYLWHESREFQTARAIARVLSANARSGETLWGDSSSTPLVALLAKIPIADHFVDTNSMRFRCGMPSVDAGLAQLRAAFERDEQTLTWLLLRPGRGIAQPDDATLKPLWSFYEEHFRTVQHFHDPHQGTYELRVRKERR